MYGNIYLNHLDSKCEANNRDPCYMFSIPKIVRPTVPLDISVVSNREWLLKWQETQQLQQFIRKRKFPLPKAIKMKQNKRKSKKKNKCQNGKITFMALLF